MIISNAVVHVVFISRVIYHELILTTKEYMRETTAIDPRWLVEFAPAFFKFSDPTKLSRRKRQERVEPLYNRSTYTLTLQHIYMYVLVECMERYIYKHNVLPFLKKLLEICGSKLFHSSQSLYFNFFKLM